MAAVTGGCSAAVAATIAALEGCSAVTVAIAVEVEATAVTVAVAVEATAAVAGAGMDTETAAVTIMTIATGRRPMRLRTVPPHPKAKLRMRPIRTSRAANGADAGPDVRPVGCNAQGMT